MKNNYKIVFVVLILLTFFEVILYFGLKKGRDDEIERIKNVCLNRLNTQTNATLNYYGTTSNILIDLILTDKTNEKFLKEMNSDNNQTKSIARTELLKKLEREYKIFQNYDFKQLHFHDVLGNSFLRFHEPNYFGDNLFGIRKTIEAANKTKQIIRGFEEGKIVNGFRNVFPIVIGGQFIGTVELSNSFAGIISSMQKNYPYEFKLIIDKKDVESKLFHELISKHYEVSTLSDYFYEEKNLKKISTNKLISKTLQNAIDNEIKKSGSFLNNKNSMVFDVNVQLKNFIVCLLPIQNFDKTITSYAVSYSKNDEIAKEKEKFYLSFILYNLAILLVFAVFMIRKYMLHGYEFSKQAYTDKLTGLFSRRKFEVDLDHFLICNKDLHNMFLIIVDIDYFKNINDNFGHDVGDKVLVQFAQVIKSSLREDDFVYRWGGEEFVLIFFNEHSENIILIAEKIKNHIATAEFYQVGKVTCSFGISRYSENDTPEDLLKKADRSLYAAKQSGRNKVVML